MVQPDLKIPLALRPGRMVQTYRIERVLGQGGFGITYLVSDSAAISAQGATAGQPPLRFALKEYCPEDFAVRGPDGSIHPKSRADVRLFEWGLRRFIDEARLLARFRHPAIVPVTRHFESSGSAFMVMAYIPGRTLREHLKARPVPLPYDEIRARVLPLLDGLAEVHALGVVHRDISPDNILLNPQGAPVLIDFGAARQMWGQRSRTFTLLGKSGYAPIEQFQSNSEAQGPWSDVYSFSAVMYRCLAGHPPDDVHDRYHSLVALGQDRLPPATRIGAGHYPPAFLQAIDWGLTVDPDVRPRSVAALRRALEPGPWGTPCPGITPEPPSVIPDSPSVLNDSQTPSMPAVGFWAIILLTILAVILFLSGLAGATEIGDTSRAGWSAIGEGDGNDVA